MRPGKRLFVGARISIAAANTLAGCAETLARRARDAGVDLRWVAPANYHVTLAFLGWAGIEAIRPLCDVLEAAVAGEPRITARTSRLGGFPSLDKASVLWAGIDDGAALTRLAQRVADAMSTIGFPRDTRPFHPHVTLARLREPRAIRDVVLPMAEQMFGDTRIDAVTLFESETKSNGSVYHEVQKIGFQRARNAPLAAEKRQTGALARDPPDREPGDAQTRRQGERQGEMQAETDDGWPRGQGPTE